MGSRGRCRLLPVTMTHRYATARGWLGGRVDRDVGRGAGRVSFDWLGIADWIGIRDGYLLAVQATSVDHGRERCAKILDEPGLIDAARALVRSGDDWARQFDVWAWWPDGSRFLRWTFSTDRGRMVPLHPVEVEPDTLKRPRAARRN